MSHFSLPSSSPTPSLPPSLPTYEAYEPESSASFLSLVPTMLPCLFSFFPSHPLLLSLFLFQLRCRHFLPVILFVSTYMKLTAVEQSVCNEHTFWATPLVFPHSHQKFPSLLAGWPYAKMSKCAVNERSRYIWPKSYWFECTTDLKHWDLDFTAYEEHFYYLKCNQL